MARLHGAAAASRHNKLKWLAKARRARKKMSSCRKLLGTKESVRVVRAPINFEKGELPLADKYSTSEGYTDTHAYTTNPIRQWSSFVPQYPSFRRYYPPAPISRESALHEVRANPELLVVSNPGRFARKAKVTFTVKRHVARRSEMGRKQKNSPLTIRVSGKRHTWKALTRRYGPKKAAKVWRKAKKLHGYSRIKVARNGRRRRARNYWPGNKKGHRLAALRGWRKHKRSKRRNRSASRRKSVSKKRPFKGAIKYAGRYWRRKALRNKIGKKNLSKLLKRRGRRNN